MRLKTNLVIGLIFLGLLGYVYLYEIKGREEEREAAEKSKQLLDFSGSEAERLVIDRGDTTVVVENQQDGWALVEPVQSSADQSAVERYLSNLSETQRERVIADSAAVLADGDLAGKYQLQSPRLKVLLETEEITMDTLFFGADSPTETYVYVQQGGDNPQIFTVRAWRFDNLDKGVFDLRDRRVLNFYADELREVRLAYVGSQITIGIGEEDEWRLQSPVEAPVDEEEVDKLLNVLEDAKIEEFVEEEPNEQALALHGLAPSALEVSLLVGENRAEKRLSIGSQEGSRYYAKDSSRAPIFQVDSTLVQALQKRVFDLRDKEPLKFDKDAVTGIELYGSEAEIIAAKDTSGTWTLVEPAGREAKSWKLTRMLSDLEGVEVKEFVRDDVEDLTKYGLADPQVRIRLLAENEEVMEVRVGTEKEGMVHLTRIGVPSVYLVERKVLRNLDQKLDEVSRLPQAAD